VRETINACLYARQTHTTIMKMRPTRNACLLQTANNGPADEQNAWRGGTACSCSLCWRIVFDCERGCFYKVEASLIVHS
jgi:hypothetical protein